MFAHLHINSSYFCLPAVRKQLTHFFSPLLLLLSYIETFAIVVPYDLYDRRFLRTTVQNLRIFRISVVSVSLSLSPVSPMSTTDQNGWYSIFVKLGIR